MPAKVLFISAGSGITAIISMLRSLDHRGAMGDVVVIHSARTREQVMFLSDLEDLDRRHERLRLDVRLTCERGRMSANDLDEVCPGWRERDAFCSGPSELLDAMIEHWEDMPSSRYSEIAPKVKDICEALRVALQLRPVLQAVVYGAPQHLPVGLPRRQAPAEAWGAPRHRGVRGHACGIGWPHSRHQARCATCGRAPEHESSGVEVKPPPRGKH